jgi:predicted amidohydrolase
MGSKPQTVRVAVTQHEPVWLDLQGTVAKTCKIIQDAAKAGAKLVAFPEVWVPGIRPLLCDSMHFFAADTDLPSRLSGVDLVRQKGRMKMAAVLTSRTGVDQ